MTMHWQAIDEAEPRPCTKRRRTRRSNARRPNSDSRARTATSVLIRTEPVRAEPHLQLPLMAGSKRTSLAWKSAACRQGRGSEDAKAFPQSPPHMDTEALDPNLRDPPHRTAAPMDCGDERLP